MIDANTNKSFNCRVSSTISKDVKHFGKQFMFDGNDETCWNSDEGEMQWIVLKYEVPQKVSFIKLQFQGGFAAEKVDIEILNNSGNMEAKETLNFENKNSLQTRKLSKCYHMQNIKINFSKCFDTYGRIIIYHLQLLNLENETI